MNREQKKQTKLKRNQNFILSESGYIRKNFICHSLTFTHQWRPKWLQLGTSLGGSGAEFLVELDVVLCCFTLHGLVLCCAVICLLFVSLVCSLVLLV